MVVPRSEEEILAELRAEQARDRVRAQEQAAWRRGGLSAPKTTPTAVKPGPEPVPGRPGTWRMATFEQQQLIVDLMERHRSTVLHGVRGHAAQTAGRANQARLCAPGSTCTACSLVSVVLSDDQL